MPLGTLARRADTPGILALNGEDDVARSAAIVPAGGPAHGPTCTGRSPLEGRVAEEEGARPAPVKAFMALPTYGYQRFNTLAIVHAVTEPGPFDAIFPEEHPGSLLAYGFNCLWVRALEQRPHGCTHFLMLHADIVPIERDWLARLYQAMVAHDAQVLSAVVPLKDASGLTSTAYYAEGEALRRLTMHEVMAGAETFTAPDLLVNTGLLLVDLRKPWVEEICFTITDRIQKHADGSFAVHVLGEDYGFSLQARRLGIPLWATRAVPLSHAGLSWYPNFTAWGALSHDDGRTWTARHHGVGWTTARPHAEARES
jgi:hypothetical protein